MKKSISVFLGAAALAVALTGCGADTAATAAETTTEAAESETAGEETAGEENAESDTAETEAPETTAGGEESAGAEAEADSQWDLDEILKEVDEIVYEDGEGSLVVSHKYGETVVPESPERIVSIKLEDLMLALDVDMVACRNFETFYLEDEINQLGIGTITVDEESDTINFEEVLSYDPDLIVIRDSFDQTIYDELSKIAPTIAFRIQDTEVSLVAIGKALGMEDKAISRLEEYEEKVADAREALKAVEGQSVALLRILKKEIRLYPYSKNDMTNFLCLDLGLTPDPMVVEYDNADNLAISMEMLPELTADHIFLVAGYGSQTAEAVEEAKARYEEIKADPLWQMVPAVQSGNVYEVEDRVWLTYGIIATELKIDEVLERLLGE